MEGRMGRSVVRRVKNLGSRLGRLFWTPGDPLDSLLDPALAAYYAEIFPRCELNLRPTPYNPGGVTVYCFQCGTCHRMFEEQDRQGVFVRCPNGHIIRYNSESRTWDQ